MEVDPCLWRPGLVGVSDAGEGAGATTDLHVDCSFCSASVPWASVLLSGSAIPTGRQRYKGPIRRSTSREDEFGRIATDVDSIQHHIRPGQIDHDPEL